MWRPLRVTPEQVVCSRLCVPVNRRNLHLQRTVSGNLQCSENQSLAWLPRSVFSGHARGRHFAPVSPELRCKQGAKRRAIKKLLSHSKRRISTGRSLAAALAGTSVARSEIPIATREIHTPSIALGWNGT